MNDVREGDVFRFRYSAAEHAKRFEPYHCFDGQLVAFDRGDGIVLVDTYWLHNLQYRGDSTCFTVARALALGELTIKCNLNDVEKVHGVSDTVYFDEGDVFNLSYQHGCYHYFAVRKGAQRSQEKMLREIEKQLADERSKIEYANYTIGRLTGYAEKVQRGELTEVWL